jgi:hypothetical protein
MRLILKYRNYNNIISFLNVFGGLEIYKNLMK